MKSNVGRCSVRFRQATAHRPDKVVSALCRTQESDVSGLICCSGDGVPGGTRLSGVRLQLMLVFGNVGERLLHGVGAHRVVEAGQRRTLGLGRFNVLKVLHKRLLLFVEEHGHRRVAQLMESCFCRC